MTRTLLLLLSLQWTTPALAITHPLTVDVSEPETLDASNRIQWRATITNNTSASTDLSAYLWPSTGAHSMIGTPEGCVPWRNSQVQCTFSLAAHSSREFDFTTQASQGVGKFGASADVLGIDRVVEHETVVFGYPFRVTNIDDSGPGSLRQAIVDINRDCKGLFEPCSVTFELDGPVPAEGFFRIPLRSALPEITASNVTFDGRAQTRRTGNTNASGPEVLIDGTLVERGHGVAFRGYSLDIRDVAIGGFPENGVDFVADSGLLTLRRVYLGVDASGLMPLPNGYRGVQMTGGMFGDVLITDSILSGNGRAGGFFWTEGEVKVQDCKVGVGSDGVTPIGNGASGLFFHNPRLRYRTARAMDNIIANNGQAGIGLSSLAAGNFAENVIRNNVNGAIDVALDGPTLATRPGNPGQGGILGPPTILSAKYENGVTTIVGRKNVPAGTLALFDNIYVYANASVDAAGLAEAEEVIGVLESVREDTFTLRVSADLRGRHVNAAQFTVYIYNWDDPAPGTSEVGLPMRVE